MRNVLAGVAMALACSGAHAREALPPPAVASEASAKSLVTVPLANPGFESTQPGKLGAPDGWWAVQHAGPTSYTFTLDTTSKRSGERSLRIDNVGPEPFGSLFQRIDALPWRGKTLRLAGWIRTEGTTGNRYGSGAGLNVHAIRGGYSREASQMRKNAVHGTTGWTRYEVVLDLSNEAEQIELGLNLFGPGSAWLDDVTLDVVERRASTSKPEAAATPDAARRALPRL